MPAIRIDEPGGMLPSLEPRDLPGAAAQTSHNLQQASSKFRPLPAALTVAASPVTNPQTIYRLARKSDGTFNDNPAVGWISRSEDINFVKGQINDDAKERTYYTFNDGSAPPRVLDVSGADRQLGVPAPASAPTVTVAEVDEFTPDDKTAAVEAVSGQLASIVREHLSAAWLGAPDPGSSTQGYVNLQDAGGSPTTQPFMARVFKLTSRNGANNGAMENTYSGAGADAFTWVYDLAAQPFYATSNASSPAWQGYVAGNAPDHVCLAFPAYALTYSINAVALAAALKAVPLPGAEFTDDPTAKLFTAEEVDGPDGTVTRFQNYLSTANPEVAKRLSAVETKFSELQTILAGGTADSLAAEVAAFYNKADVAAEIDEAMTALARYIEISRFTLRSMALSNEGASGAP
ncbi:MAG: hypothetical protein WC972_02370 [Trueperaceae bacterium]